MADRDRRSPADRPAPGSGLHPLLFLVLVVAIVAAVVALGAWTVASLQPIQ